jgi:tetratricopeptide (TPR) repeat protein
MKRRSPQTPNRTAHTLTRSLSLGALGATLLYLSVGCQEPERKPDAGPEPVEVTTRVDDMHSALVAYLEKLARLEDTFMAAGDVNRANWARRQRTLTERVEVYPYLSDRPVASMTPVSSGTEATSDHVDVSARVEEMLRARAVYLEQLKRLEDALLTIGDVTRANWARRQRTLTERVEVYPYISEFPVEASVIVAPEESIPEADALFESALARLNEIRGVPLVGFLDVNRKKAAEALEMFKQLLREYPKSDKVDDAAFYCGEIYKEYLRHDDPDDELSIKYYEWAWTLDPQTPHAARFQCAVVEDFRRHNRKRALELYQRVLQEETHNISNLRFAATRIEQLTDEEGSHLRPRLEQEPGAGALRTTAEYPASRSPVANRVPQSSEPSDDQDSWDDDTSEQDAPES